MTHEEFDQIAALAAVGAATPSEETALEAHAAGCAPCRAARDEYGEAAALIAAELAPVMPPSAVRERIMRMSIGNETAAEPRRFIGNTWWLATAATLFLALWGWREFGIRVSRERLRSQDAEIERLADHNRTLAQQRDRLANEMAALAAGGTRTIALSGQQVAPSASARVFLEPDKRKAVIFFANLPQNASDKSYQLWIIRADQPRPQSVGVFDVNNGTAAITIENLPIETAIKGLAVTLERRGGADQPTSSNFYVMGNT